MWAARVVAAIALVAVAFMLRFLIALLREGAPSVCYWVVASRRESAERVQVEALGGLYFDDDCCATDNHDYSLQLLETKGHAEEVNASNPIVLDIGTAPVHPWWRSIHPSRASVFRGHRL